MDIQILEAMLKFHSVVSNTQPLAEWLIDYLSDHASKVEQDRLGNLYAWRGSAPQIAFFGHMDSVGFIVEEVREDHVKVVTMGGTALPSYAPMVVESNNGSVPGTLLVEGEGRERTMLIDLYHEVATREVSVGNLAAFAPNFKVEEGRIHSRWLDNKLGLWVALEAWLQSENALFVATVREEHGPPGSGSVALRLPDLKLALVVDVTFSASPEGPYIVSWGEGPALTLRDESIFDRRWVQAVERVARKNELPIQLEITLMGGSDASQLALFGLPAVFVGIPIRYAHTPAEVAWLSDCEAAKSLLIHTAETFHAGELL